MRDTVTPGGSRLPPGYLLSPWTGILASSSSLGFYIGLGPGDSVLLFVAFGPRILTMTGKHCLLLLLSLSLLLGFLQGG